jgi:hypothetical protein
MTTSTCPPCASWPAQRRRRRFSCRRSGSTPGCASRASTSVKALDWWRAICWARRPSISCRPITGAGAGCGTATTRAVRAGWVSRHSGAAPVFRRRHRLDRRYRRDRRRLGPFDLAALPVGACEPRWFMAAQRVNPARGGAPASGPGLAALHPHPLATFQLTDESCEAPIHDLRAALREAGIARGALPRCWSRATRCASAARAHHHAGSDRARGGFRSRGRAAPGVFSRSALMRRRLPNVAPKPATVLGDGLVVAELASGPRPAAARADQPGLRLVHRQAGLAG